MGGTKEWASSGSTPDWMDVQIAIRAIDAIHLGMTMVTILPAGAGSTGGLHVAITTHWEVLPGSEGLSEVITERTVNEHSCEAIPAIVMGGLYAHDFAVGEAYQQRDFLKP